MTNITGILQQGETETVEFKTSFGKAVIETLVAFANTKRKLYCNVSEMRKPVTGKY